MNAPKSKKTLRKRISQALRLKKAVNKLRKWRDAVRYHKYRKIHRFHAVIQDLQVQFSTEDAYSNRWFFPRYYGGKIHEPPVTEIMLNKLQSARCFIDVGTNLGWYTCLAARRMPEGGVWGLEMDELNFRLLEKNLRLNNCTHAHVFHAAVSDQPGSLVYARYSEDPNPAFRPAAANETNNPNAHMVTVPSVTLDQFAAEHKIRPDVIKIDVEGAEISVLKGMTEILAAMKPTLFLEVHPWNLPRYGSSIEEVLGILFSSGYRIREIMEMRQFDTEHPLRDITAPEHITDNTMLLAEPV